MVGNERLRSQASHAYYYLAMVYRLYGDDDRALESYKSAVKFASPFYKAEYAYQLSKMYCREKNSSDAEKALRTAIDTARVYGYADLVDEYTVARELLESNGCE